MVIRFAWILVLICCFSTGCFKEDPCQSSEELLVENPSVRFLNHLVVECRSDANHKGVLSIYYPSHRVFVDTGQGDSLSSVIEYEHCYNQGGNYIPRKVFEFKSAGGQLLEVPGTQNRVDDIRYGYAKRGDVIYRYDSQLKPHKAFQCLDPLIGSVENELFTSYTARAEMDQFINGSWTKLTRFKFAGSMGFWLAPQDTIKLRIRLAAFEVHYYSDRVLIDGNEYSSSSDITFEILKPVNGYWPSFSKIDKADPFFTEFQSVVVGNGEVCQLEFAIPPRAVSLTFDAFVLKDGNRQPLRFILTLNGPDITTPNMSDSVSDWPLVPADMNSRLKGEDLGFPGGVIFPLWAVDKLFELGPRYSGCNPTNLKVYGEYLRKREEEREKGLTPSPLSDTKN